jgi:dienelactone hydrolase
MPAPRRIEIATADGVCEAWLHGGGDGPRPAVLLYEDALGVRPAMQEMAARLAGLGHVVLLPNVFYRAGAFAPFDAATAFGDPPERERLTALIRSVTPERLAADGAALYRGKKHGFAVSDHPVYDRDAAERHWRRLEAVLGETLG